MLNLIQRKVFNFAPLLLGGSACLSKRFSVFKMDSNYKVYVTQPIPQEAIDILKSNNCETIINKEIPLDRKTLLDNVKNIDALYCTLDEKIDKELLNSASDRLKVIATCSVGYDHIDVEECFKRGLKLGYTPGVRSATAEFAITLLLCLSRRVIEGIEAAKNGEWSTWQLMWMCGKGLKNSTLGIFGFGNIGQAIAERLCCFELEQIIFNDPYMKNKGSNETYKYVEFDELLSQSDYIICSAAATKETTEIFNKTTFSKMKRNAIFINISRGTLVNQDDLYDALTNKIIQAAALDVTTPEPLPSNHKLFKLKNCLITPHMCSAEIATRIKMATMTSENIVNGLKKEKLPSEIPSHSKT